MDRSATATLRETYRPNQAALAHRPRVSIKRIQLVALLGNRVVGTAQYYWKEDRLHVMDLGVHIDFRRRGVAKALFAYLADIGKAHGARCLSLHTVKETGNVEIFRKLGFNPISEQRSELFESDWYASLTDVYLEKLLFTPGKSQES